MHELSAIFALDLCAYAVMNNHYHVVLRINLEQSAAWTNEEVAQRWCELFRGPDIVQRWMKGYSVDAAQLELVQQYIDLWRERLANLSWFMRCLNEAIARMANREDNCTGRFWEGRFKSHALLDERALLACMAYVDLNPIRAAIARTPEQSEFTSIKERIDHPRSPNLRPFSNTADDAQGIPYSRSDYLELIDWAGRVVRSDKRGSIPSDLPPMVTRLGVDPRYLARFLSDKQSFPRVIGPVEQMRKLAKTLGGHFFQGIALGQQLCRVST